MLINSLVRHVPLGTRMCQPKSIAREIDFEGKQKRRFLLFVAEQSQDGFAQRVPSTFDSDLRVQL
jgi:hypothetical protein